MNLDPAASSQPGSTASRANRGSSAVFNIARLYYLVNGYEGQVLAGRKSMNHDGHEVSRS
jgi:hypothetical protein